MFIKKPFDLVSLFRRGYGNKRQEHFHVVTLIGIFDGRVSAREQREILKKKRW